MKRHLKLLPLLAIFAFGVALLSWPGNANAAPTSLTPATQTAVVGGTASLSASASGMAAGTVVFLTANGGTWTTASSATTSNGEAVTGQGSATLQFTSTGPTTATSFTGVVLCPATATVITATLYESDGGTPLTATVTCGSTTTTSTLVVNPSTVAVGQSTTVSGTCLNATDVLSATGGGSFISATGGTVTSAFTVSCTTAGGAISAVFTCNTVATDTFTLSGQTAVLYCGTGASTYPYGYDPYASSYPYGSSPYGAAPYGSISPYSAYPNLVVGQATQLGVTASPASVNCGSTSNVAVTVRDASGNNVPDGTAVSFTASTGTVSPATATTAGGAASAVYTSSAGSNGTATITGTSGSATGYATVSVNCSTAVVPATNTYSPPPAYSPPVVSAPLTTITPPNTGDAGLAATRHTGSALASELLIAMGVLALVFTAGIWARERAHSTVR